MSYNTIPEQVNENQLNLKIIADAINNLINIVGQLETLVGSDILNKVATNTSDIASLQDNLSSLTEQLNTGLSSLQDDLESLQTNTSNNISAVNNRISNLKEVYSEFALSERITTSTGSGTNSYAKSWAIDDASVLNIFSTYLRNGEVIELQFILQDNSTRKQVLRIPFIPTIPMSGKQAFFTKIYGSDSLLHDCIYSISYTLVDDAITKLSINLTVTEFIDIGNKWPSGFPSLIAVIRTIDSE